MFENININDVEKIIDFAGKKSSFNGDNSIPDLQKKGVTALCKILHKNQYAYLADEVGMGKTFQAIGVIAMLLKEKPDAKVLIIVPNRNVQNNWVSEIDYFQKNILKEENYINLKNFEERNVFLDSFKNSNEKENIYLTRLTTFSTISDSIVNFKNSNNTYSEFVTIKQLFNGLYNVTGEKKESSIKGRFNSFDSGKICGKFLRNHSPDFDLVIIDEAQNLRNENNATVSINYWLGLKRCKEKSNSISTVLNSIHPKKKKDSKFLLLSATPAHRSIESLRNQLLYFEDSKNIPEANNFTHEYLSQFLIRRLRTYDNKNKYDVRKIIPNDVSEKLNEDDKNGLEQRLFLALIQSKLAKETTKNNSTYKIGFLETFESYTSSENLVGNDEECNEKGKEFENNGSQNEGEKGSAPDKLMLQNLSKSFYDEFGKTKYPPHPKLNFMEEEIRQLVQKNIPLEQSESNVPDKAVIFVRRLASVQELEKRLNELYEKRIVSYWANEFSIPKATFPNIEKEFEKKYNEKTTRENSRDDFYDEEIEIDEIEENQNENDFFKWLALKKQHKGRKYFAVSKFKKSLLRNKPNSILFFENYFTAIYGKDSIASIVDDDFVKEVNSYIAGDRKRYISEYNGNKRYNSSEILPLCCFLALKRKNDKRANFVKDFYKIGEIKECNNLEYSKELIRKTLNQDSIWNKMNEYGVNININECADLYKREILKAICEKYIKSSEAILELLYCYVTTPKKTFSADDVMKRLFSDKTTHGKRIKKLFENGELICKQVLGGNHIQHEDEFKTKLNHIDSQKWVMTATGGNIGNEGVIKRFNTPFYPDVIVCTDVFKEGINLHLFCNKIYHYGLAWTPGDLEQRIGRIDRFFSKTHRERSEQVNLPEEEKTKINVNYPFLGKSVDEQQLKQVLKFKLSADPLLDSKKSAEKNIQIDINEKSVKELATTKPKDIDACPYSGELFWKE